MYYPFDDKEALIYAEEIVSKLKRKGYKRTGRMSCSGCSVDKFDSVDYGYFDIMNNPGSGIFDVIINKASNVSK